jgi:pimeloyl-ACP methyl ester carboxylesterase
VPGLGLDARAWSGVLARLAGLGTVVLLPAMGRPADAGADLRVEAQAARLLDLLPAEGDLVLVGHSASCSVVVEAARHTGVVRGLVLVGPTTDPAAATWPRMVMQWLRTASHERLWEVGVLTPQYRSTGVASMVRGMDQMRRYRTDLGLAQASPPTRIIHGAYDRIASERWCAHLAEASTASVTAVPGASHMVPLTHPQAVVDAVHSLADPVPPAR